MAVMSKYNKLPYRPKLLPWRTVIGLNAGSSPVGSALGSLAGQVCLWHRRNEGSTPSGSTYDLLEFVIR